MGKLSSQQSLDVEAICKASRVGSITEAKMNAFSWDSLIVGLVFNGFVKAVELFQGFEKRWISEA